MKERIMKIRKFYPDQVLRRLHGEHKNHDAGQLAAIEYTTRKGRKLDQSIVVGLPESAVEVIKSISHEKARVMITNANTFILTKQNNPAMASGHLSMYTVNAAHLPYSGR